MSDCQCKGCLIYQEYNKHKQLIPESSRKFFDRIMDNLLEAEEDRDYYKCILDGSWPTAKEILTSSLNKIKNRDLV